MVEHYKWRARKAYDMGWNEALDAAATAIEMSRGHSRQDDFLLDDVERRIRALKKEAK